MAGGYDLIDEGWPVVGPFLLEDRYQYEVQFVEERPLGFEALLSARALDDEVDYEISNA